MYNERDYDERGTNRERDDEERLMKRERPALKRGTNRERGRQAERTMSYVLWPKSYVIYLCPISYFLCQMFYVQYLTSYTIS